MSRYKRTFQTVWPTTTLRVLMSYVPFTETAAYVSYNRHNCPKSSEKQKANGFRSISSMNTCVCDGIIRGINNICVLHCEFFILFFRTPSKLWEASDVPAFEHTHLVIKAHLIECNVYSECGGVVVWLQRWLLVGLISNYKGQVKLSLQTHRQTERSHAGIRRETPPGLSEAGPFAAPAQ